MPESIGKLNQESNKSPEKLWKVGMDFQFCGIRATAREVDKGKDRQVLHGMPGKITQIAVSKNPLKDLEAIFTFPDGFTVKVWLNFDEIEPIKEEKKDEAEKNLFHPQAAQDVFDRKRGSGPIA